MTGPFQANATPDTVLDYLLKNQAFVVQKVSELEKSSAVIAVEIRMMRELLEAQASLEMRVRDVENWKNEMKGKSSVGLYIGNAVLSLVVAIVATIVSGGLS